MTIARELEQAERVVEDVDVLEELEGHIGLEDREARQKVHRLRERRLEELESVRISVAASLLELSEPTVRAWADLGLLADAVDGTTRRVTLKSVLHVRPVVHELQRLGRKRGLVEAVVARLEDRLTLADRAVLKSIQQMREGDLIDITPRD